MVTGLITGHKETFTYMELTEEEFIYVYFAMKRIKQFYT